MDTRKTQSEDKRYKTCVWCFTPFKDTSKRLSQRTCSTECARQWGVAKRKENGSYKRTDEQNEKMVATMQRLRKEGKCKISYEKRQKLSKQLKERWASGAMYNQSKATCLVNYGTTHPMKSKKVKKKLKETFKQKYGVNWPTQSCEVKEKTRKTRLQKGLTYQFEDKTMKDWAVDLGVSYTYFKQVVNEQGFEAARKLSLTKTGIENLLECSIKEIYKGPCEYNSSVFKIYRPDFMLPEKKLIIECDGLAWHCDRINKNKFYHLEKKRFYSKHGFTSLFFHSDEIKNKLPIVQSIVRNKLQLNKQKYFARKLTPGVMDAKKAKLFLEENHLMGYGRGRSYALFNGNIPISIIHVKWKNKSKRVLEISRYCGKMHTSVVGGFSKLLTFAAKQENPKKIITFVDERYGSGEYLFSLGFKNKQTNISFNWTDGREKFHRMKFRKNSGYENGLYKIWDCGQTLYFKNIKTKEEM